MENIVQTLLNITFVLHVMKLGFLHDSWKYIKQYNT